MSIELFRKHLTEKRAVKVIAGIDNFDIENIKKVVMSAQESGASAVDICAKPEIISEIREMTAEELNQKLTDLKAELFNLRFQLAINQLDNPMRISAVKKDIARVKTVIRENELSADNA